MARIIDEHTDISEVGGIGRDSHIHLVCINTADMDPRIVDNVIIPAISLIGITIELMGNLDPRFMNLPGRVFDQIVMREDK